MPYCATTPIHGRMTLTGQGLVLGAGTLLAKLDGKALPIEADQERIWTLLSVAYGHGVPLAVLGSLRRVAKHWHGGDKCLAAIHLAQMGLPEIGEDAAYRLSLAAGLIDAGLAPGWLAQELGFDRPAGLGKYNPDQPRVPAGSGRESGEWTSSGDAASGDASGPTLTEGRSAGSARGPARSGKIKHVDGVPKDAIVVTRPDGTPIDDPYSPKGKLMAPPRANFHEVYAEGTTKPNVFQINEDIGHFGRFDYHRDKASNTFYLAYQHASNYAAGVLMAGAGYTREETHDRSETFGYLF